jgi:hypothetical protein
MALTPTLTQVKPQVPAPNTPANYNSTVSATPGVTGTSTVTQPSGATPADWGASANVGVFGFGAAIGIQGSGGAIGVQGAAPLTNGIGVQGTSNASSGVGVQGASSGQNGIGVEATSRSGHAIQASSTGDTDAVLVTSSSANHAAVSATNTGGGYGVWASSTGAAVFGSSTNGVGIAGVSQAQDAINGSSASPQHAGVSGTNTSSGYGLWALSQNGIGVYAKGALYAAQFDGNVQVNGTISLVGTNSDVVLSDFAEDFDLSGLSIADPGAVMVLGEDGGIEPCQREYDRRVVGVTSGAGSYRPGLILDRRPTGVERGTVALVGKVYCKVDATYGSVRPGDMLTTSPTPGHAMRADDPVRAFGAVIGKALHGLPAGEKGLIPIIVALQ